MERCASPAPRCRSRTWPLKLPVHSRAPGAPADFPTDASVLKVQAAPDWLRGRAAGAFVVLAGRAYAFTDASCVARIYSAAGEFCETLTFPGCSAPPRFGVDGSAIVSLPGGGWALWIRLLH